MAKLDLLPAAAIAITGVLAAGPAAAQVSSVGPIGLWHLDGDALDASGNGHHGTILGATPASAGIAGSSYRFDGSSAIDVGNLDFSGQQYTVNAWIRTREPALAGSWRMAISKTNTAGGQTFELILGDGRPLETAGENNPAFLVWNGGTGVVNQGPPASSNINGRNGQWHMLTATYANGGQKLYFDGCQVSHSSFPGPLPLVPQGVRIGGIDGFGPFHHPWIGGIDEVSIYTRVLSDDEVLALSSQFQPSGLCGRASGLELSSVNCTNDTTAAGRSAYVSGNYWNCRGVPVGSGDSFRINVRGASE